MAEELSGALARCAALQERCDAAEWQAEEAGVAARMGSSGMEEARREAAGAVLRAEQADGAAAQARAALQEAEKTIAALESDASALRAASEGTGPCRRS